ncbi:MAG: AbrB/MazE/SpoVT family DNA-binding domain-containing protein [Nanoarchaeota archaeon]
MQQHIFFTESVKLGRKGQITLPKRIRDEDCLIENDRFIITHMPGGDIILRKKNIQAPEDALLVAISKAPPFDAQTAWKEVREERKRERT